MDKGIIFFFIFCLFIIPMVSAVPPQTQVNLLDRGVDIIHPETLYLKQGNNLEFNFWTYNSSDGATLTNTSLNCTTYLINSSGYNFYRLSNQAGANGLITYGKGAPLCVNCWTMVIPAENFSSQLYSYQIKCQGTNLGGYETGFFEVNYLGKEFSTPQAILYLSLFVILIGFMLVLLFIIQQLPDSNTRDEDGKILSVSYLKYVARILWFVEWMLVVAIVYLASNLAFAFAGEQLFAQILFTIFQVTFGVTPVILIVWLAWIFVSMFHDRQFQQMLNRGMFPQGGI